MRKQIGILIVLLFLTCPQMRFLAVGAEEDATTVESLAGTTWAGKDYKGRLKTFYFKKDGVLHYDTPEATYTNGTWRQSGRAVFMETNKHYSNYLGNISAKELRGIAWNQPGEEWTWNFTKK